MNRSVGIKVRAVGVFVGGALTLLYSAFWVRELQIAYTGGSRLPFTTEYMLFLAVACLAAGAWGVSTAFGLLNHREWARISILVFAWLCLVFCLLPMLYYPVVPLSHINGTSANFNFYVRIGATAFFASFVAVGGWFLYFFNKESVKDEFVVKVEGTETLNSEEMPSKNPLSIRFVAWYLFITAFLFTATFSYGRHVALFGHDLPSWQVHLFRVVFPLVHIFAMVGLLERRRWGRTLAICYFSFLILDTMVSVWTSGGRPVFEWLLITAPASFGLHTFPIDLSSLVALGLAVPLFALPLWIVITQKQDFRKGGLKLAVSQRG